MVRSLSRHTWFYIGLLATVIVAYAAFFSIMSFYGALRPSEAIERWGKPLPEGWSAGVMNHGEYYRWWTIRDRPLLFTLSWVGLTCAGACLLFALIRLMSGILRPSRRSSHKEVVEVTGRE